MEVSLFQRHTQTLITLLWIVCVDQYQLETPVARSGFTTRIYTQNLLLQPVITANLAVLSMGYIFLLVYIIILKQTSFYQSNQSDKLKWADIS